MLTKPNSCCGCPLYGRGRGFSIESGSGSNGVLLVGEALGVNESFKGLPFVGEAGAQLNRTLARSRHKRDNFKIYNMIACQPPNNWLEGAPWEAEAIEHCRPNLDAVIKKMNPKVIVPMGNVALKGLLGLTGIMDRRAPKRGYVYHEDGIYYVPTMHPSFVMQGNAKLTGIQAFDLQRAVDVALNGYAEPECNYIEVATDASIEQFIREAKEACANGAWLTADIETEKSGEDPEDELNRVEDVEITMISFAFKPLHAICIPWENHYLEYIQELLNLTAPFLVFWNKDFDVPRIKGKGLTMNPNILDAMYMWHFLQSDLPKGLGFVSSLFTKLKEWKSLSEAYPKFYSCRDSDAAITCTYGIRDCLKKEGRFDTFLRHHTQLDPILKDMSSTGIKIDLVSKEEFKNKMLQEQRRLDGEIQAAVPEELQPFIPRRKVPRNADLGGSAIHNKRVGVWDYDHQTGEWGIRLPFLHSSSKQVVRYMRYQKHPVPKHYKTGKETTGADEIERLAKRYPKDPLYKVLVKGRETSKIISQYLDGYEPDPKDGCIHTTFTQKPSNWRLAAENPNVQNIRRRWELANEYRKMFVARAGCVLAEFDYKAIEAVITGYYADDDDYVRASQLGVHAILQSYVMGYTAIRDFWPIMPASEIKEVIRILKREDKNLYEMCKTIVHMSNYGGTPRRILMDNGDQFKNMKEVEELQNIYFDTIAKKVKGWQEETLGKAHRNGYLENVFGYRHYYYDVFTWDMRTKSYVKWGTDAKRALSFLPSSTAAGVIKEAMLRLGARYFYRKALRWMIHDSLIFELPKDRLLEGRLRAIKEEMERPIPQLGGLSIEVETSVGPSWGEMAEWHG